MPRKTKHEVIDLLKALRAEGIRCSTVTIGGVTLDGVVDTRLAGDDARDRKPEPRMSMWDQQVDALKRMPASPKDDVPPETLLE